MRGVSVGIDIGTSSVTTAVLRRDKTGAIRLSGFGKAEARGIRRGSVIDVNVFAESLKQSAESASRASGFSVKHAVVAFGGEGIRSSSSRGVVAISRADGEITAEDVKRSLQAAEALHPKSANRELIHIIPRGYSVDSEGGIANPIGMMGMRLEVDALIIDGEKRALQNIVKAFDMAGIEIHEWMFSPLASAEVILDAGQKELGVMLLDIGAGTSDYAMFKEGGLIDAGVISLGGERVTHDIAIGFKTSVDVAEAVKRTHGHLLQDLSMRRGEIRLSEFDDEDTSVYTQKELAEIIEARLADIFELTLHTIRGAARRSLPGGIVLVGGTSFLPGIREFAKKILRLPVGRGVVQGVDIPETLGHTVGSAPALGAALWHLKEANGFSDSGLPPSLRKATSGLKNWLRIFLP